MDEVLQWAQELKNEREMVLVFHQNDRSPVLARLIAPGSRLVGFGPVSEKFYTVDDFNPHLTQCNKMIIVWHLAIS
jgi:hypothetical protein